MGFEEFEHIYGEPKAEWAKNCDSHSVPFRRFLMHVFAPDYYHIKFHVSDFHSNTFGAIKSISQLEDMRDTTGIGGTWFEFVEYVTASLKSEEIKLVVEKRSHSDGPTSAKLVAQKSRGMPVIFISLNKLADSDANEAIQNMSFGLFEELKRARNLIPRVPSEKDSSLYSTKMRSVEQDGKGTVQIPLENWQAFEKVDSSVESGPNGLRGTPDMKSVRSPLSNKVNSRAVAAHRRAKKRGAVLQDIEDDEDN